MTTQGKRKPPVAKKSVNFIAFFRCLTINTLQVNPNRDQSSKNVTAEDFFNMKWNKP